MASYFDEHDCEPLAAGQQPDHFMHMARLLIDTGYWNQVGKKRTFCLNCARNNPSRLLQSEFSAMFSDRVPPPASKAFLEKEVEEKTIRVESDEFQCPVCLKQCEQDDVINELPGCRHKFHKECITKWLERV